MGRFTLTVILILLISFFNTFGNSPCPRSGHRMVYDKQLQLVILFGGWSSQEKYLDDTWTWDGVKWEKLNIPAPSPRSWFGMAYDDQQQRVLLFGGRDSLGRSLSDTWQFKDRIWTELFTDHNPGARDHFSMDYNPVSGNLLVYGGFDAGREIDHTDTWEFDGKDWKRIAITGPNAWSTQNMAFDQSSQKIILFGGMDSTLTIFRSTWSWEDNSWAKLSFPEVEGRTHFSLIYDPVNECLIRFGGKNQERMAFADTWLLERTGWLKLDITCPAARIDHSAVYDSKRNRMVIFGGKLPSPDKTRFGDTWEWDGRKWLVVDSDEQVQK